MSEDIQFEDRNNSALPIVNDYSKMNFIQRVFGVIFSPGKVMQSLEQKPRILFALFLTMLTPVVLIFAILPMYQEYVRNTVAAKTPQLEITDQIMAITTYTGMITAALVTVASWFLGTLILWGITKIFKGEGGYKQMLSVTGYAAVISALATIVTIAVTRVTGVFNQVSYTSLASFLPEMKGSFLYGVAKGIDVFNIWYYVVIAIGTTVVSKLSKNKVFLIVACIFAAIVIYTGATEVMSAGLAK